MAKPSAPEHSTNLPLILFAGCVLVGCAIIMGSKYYGVNPLWSVTGPILVMIAYAAASIAIRRFSVRDDQTGDNLYYMGFLFTLTSLGMSLYLFTQDGGIDEIVRNFGIAVGSTIAGIAGRILFSQMRQDPVDIERSARLELADAARRVRRELDSTVIDLSNFRRTTLQVMNEGYEEVRKHVSDTSEAILTELKNNVERMSEPLTVATDMTQTALLNISKNMGETLDSTTSKLSITNDNFVEQTNNVSKALSKTATKLDKLRTPEEIIEIKLEPVLTKIADAMTQQGELSRSALEANNQALAALASAAAREEAQLNSLSALVQSMNQMMPLLRSIAEQGRVPVVDSGEQSVDLAGRPARQQTGPVPLVRGESATS